MRHEAILSLYKNVVMVDDTAGAFDVDGNQVQVDENLVAQEVARLKAEAAANAYQAKRAAEYPSYADQFDLLYHGGYDAWKAAIDAVKTKYPKA
jgi:hypothetical protein